MINHLIIIPPLHKISSKFVNSFLTYPVNRQTNKGKNVTSLVEVSTIISAGYNMLLFYPKCFLKLPAATLEK